MTTEQAHDRLSKAVPELRDAKDRLDLQRAFIEKFGARLRTLPDPALRSIDDDTLAARLQEAIQQIYDGIGQLDGVWFQELEPLRRTLGLRATEQLVTRLELEIAQLRAHIARWPDATTTHPFRYR